MKQQSLITNLSYLEKELYARRYDGEAVEIVFLDEELKKYTRYISDYECFQRLLKEIEKNHSFDVVYVDYEKFWASYNNKFIYSKDQYRLKHFMWTIELISEMSDNLDVDALRLVVELANDRISMAKNIIDED